MTHIKHTFSRLQVEKTHNKDIRTCSYAGAYYTHTHTHGHRVQISWQKHQLHSVRFSFYDKHLFKWHCKYNGCAPFVCVSLSSYANKCSMLQTVRQQQQQQPQHTRNIIFIQSVYDGRAAAQKRLLRTHTQKAQQLRSRFNVSS